MLPDTCIVVPTYWTRAGGVPRAGDAVYDHPTPLDGDSTLGPLMDSLQALEGEFYLLLIVAVTGEDVSGAADARVRDLTSQYPAVQTLTFGSDTLGILYDRLSDRGIVSPGDYVGPRTYPKIRNLQLLLPLALGAHQIVAIDDDEILTDTAFLRKVGETLGSSVGNSRVEGLSGHYTQPEGGILLQVDPAKASSTNAFDRKAAIMNRATEMLQSRPGDVVETPFCFGGNMEFTAELAARVGFDPAITRGEDIDYLLNARMEGIPFYLRKDLRVLHCPPSGGSYKDASTSKLEQDILRFMYERAKVETSQERSDLSPVTAEELMPYPGEFVSRDIEDDARQALEKAGFEGDVDGFLADARATAGAKMTSYLAFRELWPVMTSQVRGDTTLRDALLRAMLPGGDGAA